MSVLELRRYTLHPGRRDELITLFEREFVEPQEAVGAHLPGLFREPASPTKFLWLREFASMETRKAALEEFYFGPVWAAHREAANATMVDSDDVHLLRPAGRGLENPPAGRRLWVTVCRPGFEVPPELDAFGVFETLPVENDFPALPVHTDPVLVWFDRFEGALPELPGLRIELEPTARSVLR